jgi:DUF4097 and DUF4098 domain-containing protein YvlB
VVGVSAVGIGCQGNLSFDFGFLGGSAAEDFALTAPLDGIDTVGVTTNLGTIVVTLDENLTEAQINGTIEVIAARDSDAEGILAEIDIEVAPKTIDSSVLEIGAQVPDEGIVEIDFEITLPAGFNLDLTTTTGSVAVAGNTGRVEVETDTGSVQVSDNVGEVTVRTETGRVTLTGIAGNVEVTTETGSISVGATPPDEGIIDVETDAGSIDIEVPPTTAAELDLKTDLGADEVDLSDFTVTELQTSFNSVQAILNGGGGTVRARADVGTIRFEGF